MLTGTSHFVSFKTAMKHYKAYHFPDTKETVQQMIDSGEISVGKPSVKVGEKVVMIDSGTRYGIISKQ